MPPAPKKTNTVPLRDFTLQDTVLIRRTDICLEKPKPEKPKTEELHNYTVFISLEDKNFIADSNILFELPINCHAKSKPSINDLVAFDFMALEEEAKKNGDKKTANLFKEVRKKYQKVILVKNYKVIGGWLDNVLLIRPLPPPNTIIFAVYKKK